MIKFIGLALIALGIFMGQQNYGNPVAIETPYSSKFKIGECLKMVLGPFDNDDNEFSESNKSKTLISYTKVVLVGKRNYLLSYGRFVKDESSIKFIDTYATKVDCKETKKVFDN